MQVKRQAGKGEVGGRGRQGWGQEGRHGSAGSRSRHVGRHTGKGKGAWHMWCGQGHAGRQGVCVAEWQAACMSLRGGWIAMGTGSGRNGQGTKPQWWQDRSLSILSLSLSVPSSPVLFLFPSCSHLLRMEGVQAQNGWQKFVGSYCHHLVSKTNTTASQSLPLPEGSREGGTGHATPAQGSMGPALPPHPLQIHPGPNQPPPNGKAFCR